VVLRPGVRGCWKTDEGSCDGQCGDADHVALLLDFGRPATRTECPEERRHVREGGASLSVFFYCKRELTCRPGHLRQPVAFLSTGLRKHTKAPGQERVRTIMGEPVASMAALTLGCLMSWNFPFAVKLLG
jgi:hypothetical protein